MQRLGVPRIAWSDLYYYVLVQPWSVFYGILISCYLVANCGFALLYTLQPGSIDEAEPGSWPDAFFFSIETMATVGYGVMHPVTLYAHILVTVEIVFGVLAVPLATGLTILKFARPTARVLFSRDAVIAPFDGAPTLMFRIANIRANTIIEARIKVTLLRRDTTPEGHQLRRLIDLDLVRDTNPMFALTWTVMHRIGADSPLHGLSAEDCRMREVEILAVMTGLDATSSSMVHTRYAYQASHVRFDRMHEDIVSSLPDGGVRIDYRRFHETRAAGAAVLRPAQQPERVASLP